MYLSSSGIILWIEDKSNYKVIVGIFVVMNLFFSVLLLLMCTLQDILLIDSIYRFVLVHECTTFLFCVYLLLMMVLKILILKKVLYRFGWSFLSIETFKFSSFIVVCLILKLRYMCLEIFA